MATNDSRTRDCSPDAPRWTRRALLQRSALLGASLSLAGALDVARPRGAAAALDYSARETFDYFDQTFHSSGSLGQPTDFNENGGALAWGQSYVLLSFVRMYLAYKDPYYLDRLIHNADLVLATRDSERGVTDYRGLSLPAWRARHPYTVGVATLADAGGRPTLEVRSARAYADETTATVAAGTAPDTFKLTVYSAKYKFTDTFDNLTMNPASPDYAVRRVYDAYPTATMVTARDVRTTPDAAGDPAPGTVNLVSQPAIFAVHTGMITYPLAMFARLVYATPELRANPRYQSKADEYVAAVAAAVAVHDPEWRENERGEGYYAWPKGMPVPYDGTEQPVNQSIALARTLVELGVATGNAAYHDRATKLARMYRNQLVLDAGGAYIWHYWPTFGALYRGYAKTGSPETDISIYTPMYGSARGGAMQPEDISHAHISVDFAAVAFREQLDQSSFGGQDMARLARTYTQNVMTTDASGNPAAWRNVDGSGGRATSGYYLVTPGWLGLAWWDERIFAHALALYQYAQPQPTSGFLLMGVGQLNWFAQRGA